jgi:calcineurin-like phosphoesterase family protein
MIYFTADTHFNHENIIKLCGRPFSGVAEMNETLIENWNSCVKANDEIYILGDFAFKGSALEAEKIIKRLNGIKYLIRGNHDKFLDDKNFNKNHFKWIKDYYVLPYQKTKFVLFHYPLLEWDGYFGNAFHLYGHVHNSGNSETEREKFKLLGRRAINAGVDVNDFFPVSIEKIMSEYGDA